MAYTRYDDEFKTKIVKLYNSGRSAGQISKEFEIPQTNIYDWNRKFKKSGSFKHRDNISSEQKEIIELKKKLKDAEMAVDILKQAALIMGRGPK